MCAAPFGFGSQRFVCRFECTYCEPCAQDLSRTCPNCGGGLYALPSMSPSGTSASST
jgi:uncharacterized protein